MDKVRLIFLGGQDEIFKSMIAVEINDDIFVIEAGFRIPDKTKPGIDFIIPRYDYLIENKNKVKGYFLTLGFDTTFGALPYIINKVPAPIYCSNTTSDFLKGFCHHNNLDFGKLAINIVSPDSDIVLANRKISFFNVTSNFAESMGLSISSTQGNIILISNAVCHNDNDKGFTFNTNKLAKICENKTLVLLLDSTNASKEGYCSPNYNLLKVLNRDIFDKDGRVFIALDRPDLFNIVQCLNSAMEKGRKIICYDEDSNEVVNLLHSEGYLNLKRDSVVSLGEVNRLRPREVLVFICGFPKRINSKIALLASKNNDDKIVFLKQGDTFVYGAHVSKEFETTVTEAIDELYKTDCEIIRPNKNYCKMYACSEDIKSFLSVIKPAYFVPISSPFVNLLSAAMIALNMKIGLNHNNVFICDNGNIIEFEAGFGKILPNKIVSGDVFVDGKGIGDVGSSVIEERQKFADDGVIILGVTISKSKHEIVGGPDIQARGLIYLKDNETLVRDINKMFVSTINNELAKGNYSIAYMEQTIKDVIFRLIRRSIDKTPIIIPIICEIN